MVDNLKTGGSTWRDDSFYSQSQWRSSFQEGLNIKSEATTSWPVQYCSFCMFLPFSYVAQTSWKPILASKYLFFFVVYQCLAPEIAWHPKVLFILPPLFLLWHFSWLVASFNSTPWMTELTVTRDGTDGEKEGMRWTFRRIPAIILNGETLGSWLKWALGLRSFDHIFKCEPRTNADLKPGSVHFHHMDVEHPARKNELIFSMSINQHRPAHASYEQR